MAHQIQVLGEEDFLDWITGCEDSSWVLQIDPNPNMSKSFYYDPEKIQDSHDPKSVELRINEFDWTSCIDKDPQELDTNIYFE